MVYPRDCSWKDFPLYDSIIIFVVAGIASISLMFVATLKKLSAPNKYSSISRFNVLLICMFLCKIDDQKRVEKLKLIEPFIKIVRMSIQITCLCIK